MAEIDATPSGTDANSYATVAEADTYFAGRLNTEAWADADQVAALIQATGWIDQFDFRGERAVPMQPLKWPRVFVYDEDGHELPADAVPRPVKRATFEAALALVSAQSDPFAPSPLGQFEEAQVGPLRVKVRATQEDSDLPDVVERLLSRWLRSAGLSGRLWRS
jgi:hypothetical protein